MQDTSYTLHSKIVSVCLLYILLVVFLYIDSVSDIGGFCLFGVLTTYYEYTFFSWLGILGIILLDLTLVRMILDKDGLNVLKNVFKFPDLCDTLRGFVPFVQFEKREKTPWKSVTFSKVAGFWCFQGGGGQKGTFGGKKSAKYQLELNITKAKTSSSNFVSNIKWI